jgi:hypothetical protein
MVSASGRGFRPQLIAAFAVFGKDWRLKDWRGWRSDSGLDGPQA